MRRMTLLAPFGRLPEARSSQVMSLCRFPDMLGVLLLEGDTDRFPVTGSSEEK